MNAHVPNTHPILDPAWAQAQIEQHFRAQRELLDEVLRYSTALLMRALKSGPDDLPHHLVLTTLYRQVIVSADGASLLIGAGAIDAAHVQLRSMLEARWGLTLALRDPRKWGTHLFVAGLREEQSWARQAIPGTTQYAMHAEARDLIERYGGSVGSATEAEAVCAAIDATLEKDDYRAINVGFDEYEAETRHKSPAWYYDPTVVKEHRLTSIAKLAREVGAISEYRTIYRHSSYFTHGGYPGTHLKRDEVGTAVAAIRTPEGARQVLLLTFALLSDCTRRVLECFRADEVPQFVRRYAEEWRDIIASMPEIAVETERGVNLY